ncbi:MULTISPECIES: hypothetical protein [Hyphomonas]|uniref:Phage shock protein B n=2 Tax=Hyphomonas adhaerens TaxID=81029 RepID=A0A069E3P9_9PROT|nr:MULTISPECIES: hypothetical protein [Hyphomonas]KCZ84474.1 hypothetical protein HAD_02305 [Hyphomonas adhaerens MHS-3]MBB39839.1 hypothetical protein [Hyphomonas sp.]HAE26352.1 hypothetical protein [Hyphomonas adhaerens]|tara:strand:+ start:258 stop:488 length:231 start_codon:yes stop_codon:yes gene_type:complete
MDPFQMVVVIVAIVFGTKAWRDHMRFKQMRANDRASDAEFDRMTQEVARLKERVRVLEKIVTDSDKHLSEEISRLA